jgi:hypothetical protein
LAERPRRDLIIPGLMVFSKFANSYFAGFSDIIQAKAFAPFHKVQ